MKNTIYRERPPLVEPDKIEVPKATVEELGNGVKLHWLDCSERDVVRVSFVFRASSTSQTSPFSAAATANLLSEGSKLSTAHQITERLDFYGSFYNVALDRDYITITFASLSKFFKETMEVAREIILMPTFEEEEVSIYANQHMQRLAMERSRVPSKARELFTKALFGEEHPYGRSYPEELYLELTSEILKKFYSEFYIAERCFVVCSGNVGDEQLDIVRELANEVPVKDDREDNSFPAHESSHYEFELHPDALQSSIRIGKILFPRTHPDFIGMQVLSTVLGGYYGSRLMRNLREEHGYTYGVFATMANLREAGYIGIATDVGTDVTADAVAQIFHEIERLQNELISDEELESVRNIMFGEVMRILDGPFGIADVTMENASNNTDNSYVEKMMGELRTITPERIQQLAQQYFDTDSFTTVIVGGESADIPKE